MTESTRLGRGISTLIPKVLPKTENATSATLEQKVAIDNLRVNPRQPRRNFDPAALAELTASVQEKGVLQPILVRRVGHHFEIIAGGRRFRAAKAAGLATVPVHIVKMTDQEQLEAAIIENIIREDLSAIETAKAFKQLQKEFSLSQEEVAKRTGKERSTVANLLRLLQLPTNIQSMVDEKKISMGHARALLRFSNATHQDILANLIVQKGLSVRQVEQWKFDQPKNKTVKTQTVNPNLQNTIEDIQRKIGTKVEIKAKTDQKGEIRIPYFHPGELTKILQQLLK